ncbi:PAS domain S-box protein [bacterium]|nr:MAG: PAS domain S-box protein [bacterium]
MPRSYSRTRTLLPALLENLEEYALFMMDPQGIILTWTPAVRFLLGYEEAEFVGNTASLIFTNHDNENGVPQQELEVAKREGRSEDMRWHVRKDGTQFWANGQLLALRDGKGQLRGFAKILRDDTPRKQIEDTLLQTRRKLQSALDVGRIGTWMWDIPNDRVEADTNLAQFFGVAPQDAAGGPITSYLAAVHPDDTEQLSATISTAIESGDTFIADYRIVQKNGDILWVEARGQVERDAEGTPMHLNGVILDISERKRAEAAYRLSEERYRVLFEAIDNGFCIMKMLFDENDKPVDYRFLEINPTFEKQTGLSNAIGKTAKELVPDLDEFWFETYGKVALTGESIHFENAADAMGRWFDVHAFRVGVPEDRHVALLFTDITARKQGENALRQAHAQAEETNRMKDEFMATLSHELRTPLNAILGWANILRLNQGKLDTETQNQGLETIERNARTQSQLINDLLDVSRIMTGKLRLELHPVELATAIKNAINTVKPGADAKQIEISTSLDSSVGTISGDQDRLNQVFWNLLSNAIKFTPRGGHISVAMARIEEGVQVQISDSGQGISADFLPFVFERFRQADASSTRTYGGLGIGLALVRSLMEAHGGTVSASSEGEGRGSIFTVVFPVTATHAEGSEDSLETLTVDSALPLLSGVRVLVVDDEADARELVKLSLTQQGASVEDADNAATAFLMVELSRAKGRPFDILVSDIGMPEEDGYSLIRRVRASEEQDGPFLPAIALTAYATHKDRMNALMAGFQAHLIKPFEPAELLANVAALTGR